MAASCSRARRCSIRPRSARRRYPDGYIATANLGDFAPLPDGIEAQSPDEFLCNLFDLDPDGFVEVLREQAADLRSPPVSFEEVLARLDRVAPDLVAVVRNYVAAP